jgi:hypothetical protein
VGCSGCEERAGGDSLAEMRLGWRLTCCSFLLLVLGFANASRLHEEPSDAVRAPGSIPASHEEFSAEDAAELRELLSSATRQRVRELLSRALASSADAKKQHAGVVGGGCEAASTDPHCRADKEEIKSGRQSVRSSGDVQQLESRARTVDATPGGDDAHKPPRRRGNALACAPTSFPSLILRGLRPP